MTAPEPITRTYRFALALTRPLAWWGRMKVSGEEHLPRSGPIVLIGNHDSHWDPVIIGMAGMRRRQIRALAKASLWKIRPLAPILNGMRQIPIVRGAGDAGAMANAYDALRDGACIGIFPEGTISRGEALRARAGAGRLVTEVPETRVVLVAVTGTTDLVRFPKRPRITVEFFEPAGGQPKAGEDPREISVRMLAEIRAKAPVSKAGRGAG